MFFFGLVNSVTGGTIDLGLEMYIKFRLGLCMGIGMTLRADFKILQEGALKRISDIANLWFLQMFLPIRVAVPATYR
jgi:hypothetical protein